jgi:hypothetical protein
MKQPTQIPTSGLDTSGGCGTQPPVNPGVVDVMFDDALLNNPDPLIQLQVNYAIWQLQLTRGDSVRVVDTNGRPIIINHPDPATAAALVAAMGATVATP